MEKICFATHNANKLKEVRQLFQEAGLPFLLVSLDDIGCTEDIAETAETLEGNAMLKARHIWTHYHMPVFADDTGLEVKALQGAPGVYSARYAGPQKSDSDNVKKLLEALRGIENRQARFRTCIAFIDTDGQEHLFEGIVEGHITHMPRGTQGFGYDPVFCPAGDTRTFAEMPLDEKNKISHRARAFQAFCRWLRSQVS
ncbi:RdgB/HAM1 family non-canonical purine NTP pyrophosphatase [Thermonema rossianum]|uniref:RdgB/HAM1 family non-canonical purine NTP pyrophosphatase n=1 Tax=Thermonema rossianum TaxID=55505 RepID=UPI000AD371E7|nr:RdgB/HAM1 family non-canonical purine NTP pyrophosphatase [Thermonema rossianum]